MTQAAVFTLYAIEQAVVTSGASALLDSAETAELVALGILAGRAGAWTLTEYGWQVAYTFRRFLSANAGPLSMGVTPEFTPPARPSQQRAICEIARATFAHMMAATHDLDPAPVAARAIAAGQAFAAAQEAAGLPLEVRTEEAGK